ncbi:uncharacterized protein BDW43DRAFT_308355 [Aspergillus alliaceus]|uniref:uncharacterized protein n=1 Tax=Petromyces alliaceus TaxID=209559 RepID=UPI0012A61D46|nr:uncharacterized protein BDW43DRAFT_308355 [Aspergillus alliaceus]KAB8236677.1 hypothetical protein BDW43DRAFT_308355 [Aspergillus alliaceus]
MSDSEDGSEQDTSSTVHAMDIDLQSQLPDAIKRGSVEEVKRLLGYDNAVSIRFDYHFEQEKDISTGVSPIALAGGLGQNAIVRLLLDHGAKLETANIGNGSTALHLAAKHGQLETVELLLDNGAWVNDVNDFKYTPFHYACWEGHLDVAKLLVSRGAEIETVDKDGWNALIFACNKGHRHVIRWLLDLEVQSERNGPVKRVNRNQQCNKGWTPICRAIIGNYFDCAQELLHDPEVDLTIRDEEGDSALSDAARKNSALLMLDIMAMATYFPDDPISMTTCIATPYEFEYIEKGFLNNFAQVIRHPEGLELAMYWGVTNGSVPLAQQCLYYKPDLATWSRAGATWLHVAAKYGHHELLRALAARHIDLSAKADRGMTALHLAAAGGHSGAVKYILEILRSRKNGRMHQTGFPGSSALASPPGLELARCVMEENDDHESPISLAGKSRNREVKKILWGEIETFVLTTREFLEFLPVNLERFMELAAQFERPGNERILTLLLQQTSNRNPVCSSSRWTALHWAVYCSRAVLVWWLLSNGAHLRSEEIQTALDIIKDKPDRGYATSQVDLLIADLLKNPPVIMAPAVHEDDYHIPELPEFTDDAGEFRDLEGVIADFYCDEEAVDFQVKKRKLSEIIYERGPASIMASTDRGNYTDLDGFMERLKDIHRQTVPRPSFTTGEAMGSKPGVLHAASTLGASEKAPDVSRGKESSGNKGKAGPRVERQRGFRWIHIPASNVKVAEDLITRIIIDSGKTKRQHAPLVNLLKQSWIEVAAGGGKRYIKPQCSRRAIDLEGISSGDRPAMNYSTGMTHDEGENADSGSSADTSSEDEDENQDEKKDSQQEDLKGSALSLSKHKDIVALYMPFLTVAEISADTGSQGSQDQRQTVVSRTVQSHNSDETDPAIITHETMTLDQYYYSTIPDSTERDHDQVLSRYLAWQETKDQKDAQAHSRDRTQGEEVVKILSVDQLWLWIIDSATIITATTSDFDDFVDVVLDTLVFGETAGSFQRPRSVGSMMECIVTLATGPRLQRVSVKGLKKLKEPLEIFRESIRRVADTENELSRTFIESVVGRYHTLPKRDVGKEFRLLYEIKDIRDELNMLKTLAEAQETVWKQAFGARNSADGFEFEYYHPHTPVDTKLEILEMTREAESTQDAINTLLDLRQKHAGNQDAEFGRQQANTTMVFTIVTIVFLPLSFLASLFALNVTDFPHESGNVSYKSWWIFPILFGCSAAVSIPCIVIAFNVNEFIMQPYQSWRLSKRPAQRSLNLHYQPSLVRRLTGRMASPTQGIGLASVEPFPKEVLVTYETVSRTSADGRLPSYYQRFMKGELYGHRPSRDDGDCEKQGA